MGSLGLLRTNRPFRLLWTARSVSFLGDALSLVALMLYVAETTGQALAVAMLLLVGDFAPALSYVLGGLLIDLTSARTAFLVGGTGGLLATLAVAAAFRRSQ